MVIAVVDTVCLFFIPHYIIISEEEFGVTPSSQLTLVVSSEELMKLSLASTRLYLGEESSFSTAEKGISIWTIPQSINKMKGWCNLDIKLKTNKEGFI